MESLITVKGIVPLEDKETKYKQVWDLCAHLGIDIPRQIVDHFDGDRPMSDTTDVKIPNDQWTDHDHLQGVSIKLADIPMKVTKIEIQVAK